MSHRVDRRVCPDCSRTWLSRITIERPDGTEVHSCVCLCGWAAIGEDTLLDNDTLSSAFNTLTHASEAHGQALDEMNRGSHAAAS